MSDDERKMIRSRLRSYERKLRQEKKKYGWYDDGGGRRYHIAPHYMLLDDNDGALAAFAWFEQEFDDDVGTPDFWLCYSLALHRAGDEIGAAQKLRQAMVSNLYLVPRLLGSPIAALDIWHGSSNAKPGYIEYVANCYLELWTEEEKSWAAGLYESRGFCKTRERYIEVSRLLNITPPGAKRTRLVKEISDLRHR